MRNKFRAARVIALSVFCLSLSTKAWDGERKGLLLGIGGGAATFVAKSHAGPNPFNSPVLTGELGYAINNKVAVELSHTVLFADAMVYQYTSCNGLIWNDSQDDLADHAVAGLGLLLQGPNYSAMGMGWNGGYEFGLKKHCSAGLNVVLGFVNHENQSGDQKTTAGMETSFYGSLSITLHFLGY